jgi:hypothetical protein
MCRTRHPGKAQAIDLTGGADGTRTRDPANEINNLLIPEGGESPAAPPWSPKTPLDWPLEMVRLLEAVPGNASPRPQSPRTCQ